MGPRRSTLPDLPAPVGPTPTRAAGKIGRKTMTDLPAPVGPRRGETSRTCRPRSARARPGRRRAADAAPVAPQRGPGESSAARAPRRSPRRRRVPRVPSPRRRRARRPRRQRAPRAAPVVHRAGGQAPTALPDEIDLPAAGRADPDQAAAGPPDAGRARPDQASDLPAPKGFFDDGVQPKLERLRIGAAGAQGLLRRRRPAAASGRPPAARLAEPLDADLSVERDRQPARTAARARRRPSRRRSGGERAARSSDPPAFDLGEPLSAEAASTGRSASTPATSSCEAPTEVTPPPLPLELDDGR